MTPDFLNGLAMGLIAGAVIANVIFWVGPKVLDGVSLAFSWWLSLFPDGR